jgi:metal-responsive CopG/Arc/MetJ family transcriptional regulator
MRKKKQPIPDDKKKEKTAVSMDSKLLDILNKYLEDNDIPNRSKYIENLVRKDMEARGKNVDREF